jgi:hypothetical protein
VVAGLDNIFTLERNGKLTGFGYLVNAMLGFSCLFALTYPAFNILGLFSFDCPFKSLTGLPCPGCGFTRSMESVTTGDISGSFLHNPGWIILVLFLATMTGIGIKSMIKGRQVNLGNLCLILFVFFLVCTWIGKFLLGSAHY